MHTHRRAVLALCNDSAGHFQVFSEEINKSNPLFSPCAAGVYPIDNKQKYALAG